METNVILSSTYAQARAARCLGAAITALLLLESCSGDTAGPGSGSSTGGTLGAAGSSAVLGGGSSLGGTGGAGTSCVTNGHCTAPRPWCDPGRGICVGCLISADCAGGAQCIAGACLASTACENSRDCTPPLVCNGSGRCVECVSVAECQTGQLCVGDACRAPCSSDTTCRPSNLLCDPTQGHCVECLDAADCSGGRTCQAGTCGEVASGSGGTTSTGGSGGSSTGGSTIGSGGAGQGGSTPGLGGASGSGGAPLGVGGVGQSGHAGNPAGGSVGTGGELGLAGLSPGIGGSVTGSGGTDSPAGGQTVTSGGQGGSGGVGAPTGGTGPIHCGDSIVDPDEACDDGNHELGDGCSTLCQKEPNCSGGACTSACGDGMFVPDGVEACDDGNTASGDGCSPTCQVEEGYECFQPSPGPTTVVLPIIYRDFRAGGDFEPTTATGINAATAGLIASTLDAEGKPRFVGTAGQGNITSETSFAQWYRDVAGVNTTYPSQLVLWDDARGGYANRMGAAGERWKSYSNVSYCGNGTDCPQTDIYDCPSANSTENPVCIPCSEAWGSSYDSSCSANLTLMDGNPVFFPLDGVPNMITPTSEYATAMIPPVYAGTWMTERTNTAHNFHFTSETRSWFRFLPGTSMPLEFSGDDDVWVFINRQLVMDLGGLHTPVNGSVTFTAEGNATVTVTQTEPTPVPASVVTSVTLGLQEGRVYEIVVFHAERKRNSSTYRLDVPALPLAPTQCRPAQ